MKRLWTLLVAVVACVAVSAQEQDTVFVDTAYCDGQPIAMTFRYVAKSGKEWVDVGVGRYGFPAIDTATVGRVVVPDSVVCPDGRRRAVIHIGRSAFAHCSRVTWFVFPIHMEEVGDQAFHDCTSLTELTLSPVLRVIWPFAFRGCHRLGIIRMLGRKRPVVYDNIFDQQTLDNATLIVPVGCMDEYTNSLVFGMFRYRVEAFE